MEKFKVVSIQHEYPSTERERRIVMAAGGEYVDTDGLSLDAALRHGEEADAILVRWLKIGPDLIRRFRRCKIIVRYGVGYDNVDLAAATEANIMVGHSPSYCLDEVATHALALLLACVRNSEESVAELQITVAGEATRVCTGGLPLSLANPEVLRRLGRFAEWTPSDAARWQMKRLERLRAKQVTSGTIAK